MTEFIYQSRGSCHFIQRKSDTDFLRCGCLYHVSSIQVSIVNLLTGFLNFKAKRPIFSVYWIIFFTLNISHFFLILLLLQRQLQWHLILHFLILSTTSKSSICFVLFLLYLLSTIRAFPLFTVYDTCFYISIRTMQ